MLTLVMAYDGAGNNLQIIQWFVALAFIVAL